MEENTQFLIPYTLLNHNRTDHNTWTNATLVHGNINVI